MEKEIHAGNACTNRFRITCDPGSFPIATFLEKTKVTMIDENGELLSITGRKMMVPMIEIAGKVILSDDPRKIVDQMKIIQDRENIFIDKIFPHGKNLIIFERTPWSFVPVRSDKNDRLSEENGFYMFELVGLLVSDQMPTFMCA